MTRTLLRVTYYVNIQGPCIYLPPAYVVCGKLICLVVSVCSVGGCLDVIGPDLFKQLVHLGILPKPAPPPLGPHGKQTVGLRLTDILV